jgi:hypothetical protein
MSRVCFASACMFCPGSSRWNGSKRNAPSLLCTAWFFVIAFNLVGTADILLAYYHAIKFGLPAVAGQLGAAYPIPILYVPMLIITHFVALYWLVRPRPKAAPVLTGDATKSEPNFIKEKNNV